MAFVFGGGVQGLGAVRRGSRPTTMCAQQSDRKKVLFVCLGNICRSPSAEAMFKAVVEQKGKEDMFEIDSCGTGGGNPNWYKEGGWSYHEGDDADPRMTKTAASRGITLTSKSRPLTSEDIETFDRIIAMDNSNTEEIMRAASYWGGDALEKARTKTSLMLDYSANEEMHGRHVPDPYYGGPKGFERVLDLLEDACEGLLTDMEKE